jgi:hypothetical protein
MAKNHLLLWRKDKKYFFFFKAFGEGCYLPSTSRPGIGTGLLPYPQLPILNLGRAAGLGHPAPASSWKRQGFSAGQGD